MIDKKQFLDFGFILLISTLNTFIPSIALGLCLLVFLSKEDKTAYVFLGITLITQLIINHELKEVIFIILVMLMGIVIKRNERYFALKEKNKVTIFLIYFWLIMCFRMIHLVILMIYEQQALMYLTYNLPFTLIYSLIVALIISFMKNIIFKLYR